MQHEYDIREMALEDAAVCAEMRMRLIPDTFINVLGIAFLRDVYFPALCLSSECIAYVAVVGGYVVAFLTIAPDYTVVKRDIFRKRPFAFLKTLAVRFLESPRAFAEFVRFLTTQRPSVHAAARAEILGIAVEGAYRNKGIAVHLLQRGLAELDRRRGSACRVQTWKAAKDVQRLYRVFGFGHVVEFTMLGRQYAMLVRKSPGRDAHI